MLVSRPPGVRVSESSDAYQQHMKMTVFGTGYLGATHAVCMAELGHDVLGVDIDQSKVDKLSRGEVPFFEPGLTDMLEKNLASGRLQFTTSYSDAADFADIHFVGVGTPQKKGEYAADLSHVHSVIDMLAPLFAKAFADSREVDGAGRHGSGSRRATPSEFAGGWLGRGGLESGVPA